MVEVFTPADLRAELLKTGKSTSSNYSLIELVQDTTLPLLFLREEYGPEHAIAAETWRHTHFPRSSPDIVLASYHEGKTTLFLVKEGSKELTLVKGKTPIGIEELTIKDDEARIVYAGFAGGGVSASRDRGLAEGVRGIEIIEQGGGNKLGKGALHLPVRKHLIIGIDDTDMPQQGATYALAREISDVVFHGVGDLRYTNISECNLFPVKERTSNCFATAIGITYDGKPQTKEKIIRMFVEGVRDHTDSDYSVVVVFDGFIIPAELEEYGMKAKTERIDSLDFAKTVAGKSGVEWYYVGNKPSPERGLIGALGSVGLFWKFRYVAAPPSEPMPEEAKHFPNFYSSNPIIAPFLHSDRAER